jgi:uncharacterized protein YjbI with pentapeptide repeats
MADENIVAIVKRSIEAWNQWRVQSLEIKPDLSFADLTDTDLGGADFRGVDFSNAELNGANLINSDLSYANLNQAELVYTNFSSASLQDTDFTNATMLRSIFADTDLSQARGLDSVEHDGPSEISTSTLCKSSGNIPESFLRGCGLSDWEIENAKLYNPDLSNEEITDIQYKVHQLRAHQPIQLRPLFISYSHNDASFVDAIENQLKQRGIRYWRDIHHAVAGKLESQIDRAINLNDIVLLILSEHSTSSDWVEHEARKAREKERKSGKDALCPVALDRSWKTCGWPERLREQIMEYNILDFSNWLEPVQFDRMFSKLIDGLSIFYK